MPQLIKVQKSLYEMKQEIERLAEEAPALNYRNTSIWSNSDISPDNSNIPKGTKTRFHVEQAEENGTLDQIQSYHDPLAFTVNAGFRKSGVIKTKRWKGKVRVWDVSRISFLAREGSSAQSQNYNEFEVWVSNYQYRSERFQDFMEKEIGKIE